MLVSERLQVPALPSAVVSGFSACFVKMQFPRRQGGTWGAGFTPGLNAWSLLDTPLAVAGCPDSLLGPSAPASPGGRAVSLGSGAAALPLFPETESSAGLCVAFPHLLCSGDGAFRVH